MQYITKLRQSLTDKAIAKAVGMSISGVQNYTQGRKQEKKEIKDYVVEKVQEFLDATTT